MAATHWRDWDRRVIGWFLCGLLVLVTLVGDPRGGGAGAASSPEPSTSPVQLCGSLDAMAAVRDDLVARRAPTTMADLRAAATRTRELGARLTSLDDRSRAGLVYFTGLFLALPDHPTTRQLQTSGAPASITDQAHADAFVSWLQGNCPQPSRPGPA